MAINNKPASAYAGRAKEGLADLAAKADMSKLSTLNPSVGAMTKDSDPKVKTSGIKIRGTGCATKGTMARGPMA